MTVSTRWRIDPETQWVEWLDREAGEGDWMVTATQRVCTAIADNEGRACPSHYADDEQDQWCDGCAALRSEEESDE